MHVKIYYAAPYLTAKAEVTISVLV